MNQNILAVTSSPRQNGTSTYLAERVIEKLRRAGATVEQINIRDLHIGPCRACDACRQSNSRFCVMADDMKPLYNKLVASDAILLATPVYWFTVSAQLKLFIDRFYGLNNAETKILKGKKIGIILAYGDVDVYGSGGVNALRMFEDMFRYTESPIVGTLYKTEMPEEGRGLDPALDREISALAQSLLTV